MSLLTEPTTIYLEPKLHQALKMQSVETKRSVSVLINDYLREQLFEDIEDLQAFHERANEPVMTYESLLQELRADGKL